jgi:putative oxygen-independent coproporphyrinogen III oxidase
MAIAFAIIWRYFMPFKVYMPIFTEEPPISLYIHIPWCVRKCPYCDFNSHEAKNEWPEELYFIELMKELDSYLPLVTTRPFISIFFGGGTPSIFKAKTIGQILEGVYQKLNIHPQAEITLEANPGTIEQARFHDFLTAGINRLSLGIQSLQDDKLKKLGRIHDRECALNAIKIAKKAGFHNFNLDIMYGLPQQSLEDALSDLKDALQFEPTHFSWYQLTIEPNTLFHYQPPSLPVEETIWEMQQAGCEYLQNQSFNQYEVSAYSLPKKECVHNRNYWEFGDYLGIGAGAHSKITDKNTGEITRLAQVKHPKNYFNRNNQWEKNATKVGENDIIFEFMLNALRLTQGITETLFTERTGLSLERIQPLLLLAKKRGLLDDVPGKISPSHLGKKFLNDLIALFLP